MDLNNLNLKTINLAQKKTAVTTGLILISLIAIIFFITEKTPVPGIYEGIIPTNNGPGKNVTAFIYPNGKCYIKTIHFKKQNEIDYELGRWEQKKNTLIIFPNENTETYYFRIKENKLTILDKQARTISESDHNLALYKLTDIK